MRLLELERALNNPEVRIISCDVFDTLIFRHAGTPEQFWHNLGKSANQQRINCDDDAYAFVERRKAAEEVARSQQQSSVGHSEVMLSDIYACWPSSNAQQLQALELGEEFNNWRINSVLATLLLEQQKRGRHLILISDMYLPSELIRRFICEQAPLLTVNAIYVSGEHRSSKRSGQLFARVLKELALPPSTLLHIGDDKITDLQMANAAGLNCVHVPLGEAYLAQLKYEQRLHPIAIPGLEVLRRTWPWHADGSSLSLLAGHVYAPILYAFARWVISRCQLLGIKKLFCLLREGELISNLIQLIPGHNIYVQTLHVSRRSTFLPSLPTWSVDRLNQLSQRRGYTLQEVLEDLGLSCPENWLNMIAVPLSELIKHPSCWHDIVTWIAARQDIVEGYLGQQRIYLQTYLQQQGISNTSDIAILDWGCGGSLLHNLCSVADLPDVEYFMFYSSRKALNVALRQKLHVFQPSSTQAWRHALAAYPEVSEILLNGTLESTRAYGYQQGRITPIPVTPTQFADKIRDTLDSFTKAILEWAKLASDEQWLEAGPSPIERHYFVGILYRLIQYPTWQEADSLAWLPVPLSGGKSLQLLNQTDITELRNVAIEGERAFQLGLEGTHPIVRKGFWYPGLIALAFPGQLQLTGELACYQDDDKVGPLLLQSLQKKGITQTALYGAGELGLRVYDLLHQHGIVITHVIDRRAETASFSLREHKAISLTQAKALGVTCFTVASRAFASDIYNTIMSEFIGLERNINIILYE